VSHGYPPDNPKAVVAAHFSARAFG